MQVSQVRPTEAVNREWKKEQDHSLNSYNFCSTANCFNFIFINQPFTLHRITAQDKHPQQQIDNMNYVLYILIVNTEKNQPKNAKLLFYRTARRLL